MFNSRLVFIACCQCLFLFGMVLLSLGSILPGLVERFQVNEVEAGTLVSLMPLGILAGSLYFGPFVDRYGYKWVLIFSCLLVFLGLEGLAYGSSWNMILIAIFLIGSGGGALNGACSALVVDTSKEGEAGADLSTLGVFFGLGALGMPLILAALSPYFEIGSIFAGMGIFVFLIIAYLLWIKYPTPKQSQGFPIKEGIKLMKSPILLLLAMILFFDSGIEALVSHWTTSYLHAGTDIADNLILFSLTVHMGALTLMRFILGWVLKRFSSKLVLLWSLVLSFIGCLIIYYFESYASALVALTFLGFGFAGVFPIVLGKIGEYWAEMSGTAFSICLVISLTGNTIINYLMGQVSFYYDISFFPLMLIGVILFQAFFTFRSWKYL